MILEWIWFFTLTVTTAIGAARLGPKIIRELDNSCTLFALLCLAGASLYVSWPVLGGPLASWVGNALPQSGTSIHTATVAVVMVIAVAIYLALVLVFPALLMMSRTKLKPRKFVRSFTLC